MRALAIRSAVTAVIVAAVGYITVGCTEPVAATTQQHTMRPGPAGAGSAPDRSCPQPDTPSIRPMRWGFYPGYGCGPVPPAQTVFS